MAKTLWPTEADVPRFYGKPGTQQKLIAPPYQLFLYDTRNPVKKVSVHKLVADSAMRVLTKVLEEYGEKEIDRLHLNRFFGALNVRKMRGSRSKMSMHSWGIALDFDATRNGLRTKAPKASFSHRDYIPWWAAWEAEGWYSLGCRHDYDWMHVQAATR